MRGEILAQSSGGPTITLPSIDLTKVIPDLVLPFLSKLAQIIADALTALWTGITNSGFNVLTRTAPEWTYSQPAVVGLVNDAVPAINGITALAVVMAGIGLIGREFWGWTWGPVEAAAKIAMAVVLGTGALRLCAWSIDLVDSVNAGLGGVALAAPPQMLKTGSPLDVLVSSLLVGPWVICGLLLWLLMAERLGMLALLLVLGPVALGLWGIPQARWLTITWAKFWVGWLIAQPLALICLKLAAVFAGLFGGGFTVVLFGIAMLLLARKAAMLFVPGGAQDWGGTVIRVATTVALRQ